MATALPSRIPGSPEEVTIGAVSGRKQTNANGRGSDNRKKKPAESLSVACSFPGVIGLAILCQPRHHDLPQPGDLYRERFHGDLDGHRQTGGFGSEDLSVFDQCLRGHHRIGHAEGRRFARKAGIFPQRRQGSGNVVRARTGETRLHRDEDHVHRPGPEPKMQSILRRSSDQASGGLGIRKNTDSVRRL
jgi:hypothetical protein